MASTTAEVLLYFQCDKKEFKEAVDKIRFSFAPPLEAQGVIDLISPIWRGGYDEGYWQAIDEERG